MHCTITGSTMTWPVAPALSLSLPGEEGHIQLGPLLLLSEFEVSGEAWQGWAGGSVAMLLRLWKSGPQREDVT